MSWDEVAIRFRKDRVSPMKFKCIEGPSEDESASASSGTKGS